jgi:hypothetical protein
MGADEIIVATGSLPDGKAFQRAMPEHDSLPGIECGQAWSAEDVMGRAARLGKRVILLDETANWKGAGTALYMAESGHEVTIVTGAASVMAEMARTNVDPQLRTRLRELGVRMITEAMMLEWHGDGATIQPFGGKPERISRSLVVAATNVSARTSRSTRRHPSAMPPRPATPPWLTRVESCDTILACRTGNQ